MHAASITPRRITVRRPRWSPFVVPTLVIVAAGAMVAGTIGQLDASVLSVPNSTQSAVESKVQVWSQDTPTPAGGSGVFSDGITRTLADGVVVRLSPIGSAAATGVTETPGLRQTSTVTDPSPSLSGAPGIVVDGSVRAAGSGSSGDGSTTPGSVRAPAASGVTPGAADSDGDGLTDEDELRLGSDPLSADTDGDGLPDAWEARYGTNIRVPDAKQDRDGDGVDDKTEYDLGLDPTKVNTTGRGSDDGAEDADGDGVPNAVEVLLGSDPGDATSVPDAYKPAPTPAPTATPTPTPEPTPEPTPTPTPEPTPEVTPQPTPETTPAPVVEEPSPAEVVAEEPAPQDPVAEPEPVASAPAAPTPVTVPEPVVAEPAVPAKDPAPTPDDLPAAKDDTGAAS